MSGENRSGNPVKNVPYPVDLDDAVSMRFWLGPIPTQFVYAASPQLDTSANRFFQMTDAMTADMALTLLNGQDGRVGEIGLAQDGTGGRKITGITAAGRTVQMRDDLTTINTVAFKVASAKSILSYQYITVNGVALLYVSVRTGIAAAFG